MRGLLMEAADDIARLRRQLEAAHDEINRLAPLEDYS